MHKSISCVLSFQGTSRTRSPGDPHTDTWCSLPLAALATLALLAASPGARASHVPLALDVDGVRPNVANDGYLEFINPTEFPNLIGTPVPASPPGVIQTEEFTGYTLPSGVDVIEVGDSDTTAGDRADFDWVQENRAIETGSPPGGNHPGSVGAMGWTVGSPDLSPHIDPATGAAHQHSDEEVPAGPLPHLDNDAWTRPFFSMIDVFSIISSGEDTDVTRRDAALDYVVAFGNSVTGASSVGVPVIVWTQGWTTATTIDDYVARWIPAIPGQYDLVAIEPAGGVGHDGVTEIDAIKAVVPIPAAAWLFGSGLIGIVGMARRKKA